MFDFDCARQWLEAKSQEEGSLSELDFTIIHSDTYKPSSVVKVIGKKISGQFSVWKTGEADFDIYDKSGDLVAYKWGMMLHNESLPIVFEEFLIQIR